jgi:energy-converting hydrogenase Eha subunit H
MIFSTFELLLIDGVLRMSAIRKLQKTELALEKEHNALEKTILFRR